LAVLIHELAHLFLGHTGHKLLYYQDKEKPTALLQRNMSPTAEELEGFEDVTNESLTGGIIDIIVPEDATPDTYHAFLTVKNSTAGCNSGTYDITIVINPLPETSEINSN